MGKIQNTFGNRTEENIAEFFHSYGYWAFIIPKKVNGQPFDIIARQEDRTWFVDAKHLEKDKASFPFSRIEPNQITSMNFANKYAHIETRLGFVIEWERTQTFYFLHFLIFKEMQEKGLKSVKIEELAKLEELL